MNMAKEKPATKICKHCKTEIPYDAKVCPNCRRRVKGGKLRWILLALVVIFAGLVVLGGNSGGGGSNSKSSGRSYDDAYNELNLVQKEEYGELFSNPDAFANRTIDIYGQVFNILGSDSGTVFQMYTDKDQNNFVIVIDPQGRSVNVDDYVLVKGVIDGAYSGENRMGASLSCPKITATYVDPSNYVDAFSPTLKSVEPSGAKWSEDGLTIKIERVEFAENETRVYVKLKNKSSDSASLYNCVLLQGEKQYDRTYDYKGNYDELQDSLKSGASDTGVITFPAIELSDFDFIFTAAGEGFYTDETISVDVE